MAEIRHTAEKVIEAIQGSSGIKIVIARRLGLHRNSVENYLKRYASAREAYDNEVETVGDVAESVIITAIKNSDVDTAKWYAKVKLKSRGYVERPEISGENGNEIVLRVIYGNKRIDDKSAGTA